MGFKWLRKKWRIGTLLNFINEKKLRLWSLCGLYFNTYSICTIFPQFEIRFSSIWPIFIKIRTHIVFLSALKKWRFWRALQRLLGGFNVNSWINMPHESHVTLFRWPFLSNKALAVTWVQPKTPSDSFIRSIRVQTWMKITPSRSKSKIHVFDRPVLFHFFRFEISVSV